MDELIVDWLNEANKILKEILEDNENIRKGEIETQTLKRIKNYIDKINSADIYTVSKLDDSSHAASASSSDSGDVVFTIASSESEAITKESDLNAIRKFLRDPNQGDSNLSIYVDTTVKDPINSLVNNVILTDPLTTPCFNISDIVDASGAKKHCNGKKCKTQDLQHQIEVFEKCYRLLLNTFVEGTDVSISIQVSQNCIEKINLRCSNENGINIDDIKRNAKHLLFETPNNFSFFRLTIKKTQTEGAAGGGGAAGAAGAAEDGAADADEEAEMDEVVANGDGAAGAAGAAEEEIVSFEIGEKISLSTTLRLLAMHLDENILNDVKAKGDSAMLVDIIDRLQWARDSGKITDAQIALILCSTKQIGDLFKIVGTLFFKNPDGTSALITNYQFCGIGFASMALRAINNEFTSGEAFNSDIFASNLILLLGTEKNPSLFKCSQDTGTLKDKLSTYFGTGYKEYKPDYVSYEKDDKLLKIAILKESGAKSDAELTVYVQRNLWEIELSADTDAIVKKECFKSYNFIKKLIDIYVAICKSNVNNALTNSINDIDKRLRNLNGEIERLYESVQKTTDEVQTDKTAVVQQAKILEPEIKKTTDEILS